MNPSFGLTEAVTLPVAINVATKASGVNADRGISNKPLPLPLNIDAETPNWNVEKVLTTNPVFGAIDAVAEPLAILVATSESILSADNGILNNPSPLPLKNPLPDGITTLPLTKSEPVNLEPLAIDVTTNPVFGATDAVTLPLANLVACGKLNKSLASPKNEPVNEPVNEEPVILLPINSLCILTDPVNCCMFWSTLPNIFEPDENTIDDETIFTIICSAKIDLSTIKLP